MIASAPVDGPASLPWALQELTRMLSLVALGAACVFAGWAGSSSTGHATTGQLWLIVGIVGIVLEGAGIATWILMGARRVRGRQAELFTPLLVHAAGESEASGPVVLPDATLLVSTPEMTRYHRPQCELVVGKDVASAPLRQHLGAGRQACGVCAP